MSEATHARAMRNHVDKLLTDAKWAKTLADILQRLRDGFYDQEYVNTIVQKFDRFDLDIYDAYGFSQVHTMLHTGELYVTGIDMHETPGTDKSEKNAAALSDLKSPFEGYFAGGWGDEDGWVKWKEPIDMDRHTCAGMRGTVRTCPTESVFVNPFKVPLEVGTTAASRTLVHIQSESGVARWAYGSQVLLIYYKQNKYDPFKKIFNKPAQENISEVRGPHLAQMKLF